MTFTTLIDTLQSLELKAKSTFADDPFASAKALLNQKTLASIDNGLGSDLMSSLGNISSSSLEDMPQPPVGAAELETQITGRLESLLDQINIESLAKAIPQYPGAEVFESQDLAGIKDSIGNLTTAMVGNSNFGQLNVSTAGASISAEFDAFLKGASAFPSRLLNALIQAFKGLLEKLKNPNSWLDELGEEALTDVFVEQVKGVAASLPPVAMRQGAKAIQDRGEQALELVEMIKGLNRQTATEADLAQQRKKVRQMELILDDCDRILVNATLRINGFKVEDFIQLLKDIPNDAGSEIKVLSQIFEPITSFVEELGGRIEAVTTKLKELIDKVINLLDQGIEKVKEITNDIVIFIKGKLSAAQQALQKMEEYIGKAIGSIEKFITNAGNQVEIIVARTKQAINKVATTAKEKIESIAETVKIQTDSVSQYIKNIKDQIDDSLGKEELKNKLQTLLSEVTSQLDSNTVKEAIETADESIKKMTEALKKITLKPTFDLVVTKSNSLEDDFRKIDATKLGTAQKTALGVGKKVLESVDVPEIVTPKLKEAFEDILEPVENIVDQIQREVTGVKAQVKSFEPGKLLEDFLQPHISKFVEELNQYRPSELLKSVKVMYDSILKNLSKLDPSQLLAMLEGLYQNISKMARTLSPGGLVKLLEDQKQKIQNLLDALPIDNLINRIKSALGSVEKLFAGLGLDEMMDSRFWTDLKEIFDLNLDEPIQKLDELKEIINTKVSQISEERLSRELDSLREIINTFSENSAAPEADYIATKELLSASWTSYSEARNSLKQVGFAELAAGFEHSSKTDFYYEDLVERLEGLYNRLANQEIAPGLEEPYDLDAQYKAWVEKASQDRQTAEGKRLMPAEKHLNEIQAALQNNSDLIAAFKDTLPSQLESQFVGPIHNILTLLNEVLANPREILENIEKVMQVLADAPGKITEILSNQTERLRLDFSNTVKSLSTETGKVIDNVSKTLNSAYQMVEKTLKSLRPTTLLNTFYSSDFKPDGLKFLLEKLKAESRDPMTELLWGELNLNQQLLLTGNGLKGEAVVEALNKLLTTDSLYSASNLRDIELPAHGKELVEKFSSLSEDQRLRLNRIVLESEYGEALVLSMQSVFPFFMETLKDLYPEAIIQELDQTHAKIVAVVRNLPQNIGAAVQDAYIALMDKFEELIGARIDRIFLELKQPLWRLQRDLGVGLEDISDSYRRLLSAVPV